MMRAPEDVWLKPRRIALEDLERLPGQPRGGGSQRWRELHRGRVVVVERWISFGVPCVVRWRPIAVVTAEARPVPAPAWMAA
jgi:hypothetical protein